jgi:hypothetical protein
VDRDFILRQRSERASPWLAPDTGLARVGVIAVDGTKVQANASRNENLDYEQIARAILEEAKAVDTGAGATSSRTATRSSRNSTRARDHPGARPMAVDRRGRRAA